MSVESSPLRRRALLPFWLFMLAWAASSFVPTGLLLTWRLVGAELGLTGTLAEDAKSVDGLLEILVSSLGILGMLLFQACLLHQFRDRTRGWVFANLGAFALYLVVVGIVGGTASFLKGELDLDQWRAWTVVCFNLMFVAVTCSLFRAWGWRHLVWLTYGIVMSLTTPLFELLRQLAEKRTGQAITDLVSGDQALVVALSEVAGDIASTLPLSIITGWVLWRYVAVHRPAASVDAPACGA